MMASEIPVPIPEEAEKRFWAKVKIRGDEECWEWQACRKAEGYGRIVVAGHVRGAHRVSWIIANAAPIPENMLVMHRCDNPPCVNPAHLRLGTDIDNANDMLSKGRDRRPIGTESPLARVTEQDVRAIRESKLSSIKIAPRYGISATQVRTIRRRESWRHVA
jgi:hypothetical protein